MADLTETYYRRHHGSGSGGPRRYGFTIGGRARIEWIRTRVGTGKRVLDIGCRDGTLTSAYASGNTIVGVDIDANALELARAQHGFETHHLNLNTATLPFGDGTFDVVVAGEVLEHLQFPDAAVTDVHRVLRPGGRFIGSVPNAFRLRNRIEFLLGREFESDPTHLHQFSPRAMRSLLALFHDIEIDFLDSRHLWLSRSLMGTQLMFAGRK
jgi:2-polyprenyl-3-methyl-5-hydroxy-6-metoxy-1,4-benzoquinol methylase